MILREKSRVYARLFGALIRAEVALIRFQAVYAAAEHYVAYGGSGFTRYALKKVPPVSTVTQIPVRFSNSVIMGSYTSCL